MKGSIAKSTKSKSLKHLKAPIIEKKQEEEDKNTVDSKSSFINEPI